MMRKIWITTFAMVMACGTEEGDDALDAGDDAGAGAVDGPPPPDNPGFVIPARVTKANKYVDGAWRVVGDADWSCLGTPSTDRPSTGTVALRGRVLDLMGRTGVGDAEITAWSTSPDAVVGTATSSDAAGDRGAYVMTLGALPAGTRRYGFTIDVPGSLDTRILGAYYPPGGPAVDDHVVVPEWTAVSLPAFIGVTRDATQGMVMATMTDCQGRRVSDAVAGVSRQAGGYASAGGHTFYFSASNSGASLPVRNSVSPLTNSDGMFLVMNVPPRDAGVVQVWGFRSVAEVNGGTMTLLAEIVAPFEPDTVASTVLEPRRN